MAEEEQLSEVIFDAVVVGTGLAESVLSAALARVGRRVLHIDPHDFYGGACSTHTLPQLSALLLRSSSSSSKSDEDGSDSTAALLRLRTEGWTGACDVDVAADSGGVSAADSGKGRRFCADLTPALLLSAGPAVALLVRSGVARYLEFRAADACLFLRKGAARPLPNSRAALFSDTSLGLVEKRQLMRFLQAVAAAAEAPSQQTTLVEMMRGEPYRLQPGGRIEELVAHGIALAPTRAAAGALSSAEGCRRIAMYAASVGRYGSTATPFLAAQYGTSELAQAFCREAAVYGTTFVLRCAASRVVRRAADGVFELAVSGGPFPSDGVAHARWVAASAGLVQSSAMVSERRRQRCIVATAAPLFAGRHGTVFLVVPPGECSNADSTVFVTQYDAAVGAAPDGHFLVQFDMDGDASQRPALRSVVEALVDISEPSAEPTADAAAAAATADEQAEMKPARPKALWCSFHTQVACVPAQQEQQEEGVSILPESADAVDFAAVLERVEAEFRRICGPDVEFLPAMPDPEDVVWPANEDADAATASTEKE